MKQLITLISVTALSLAVSGALAASHGAGEAIKKAPSFMFVVSAKTATVTKSKDDAYIVTIKKSNLGKVIAFSDRPKRIVKDITTKVLAVGWSKGNNSFAIDPPNAVISGSHMKPQIVVINKYMVTPDSIRLTVDSKHPLQAKHVNGMVIVIDSSQTYINTALTSGRCHHIYGCKWPKAWGCVTEVARIEPIHGMDVIG